MATATFGGRRRTGDTMSESVAIATSTSATQCLSVVIATFGGLLHNINAFSVVGIMTLICALNTNTKFYARYIKMILLFRICRNSYINVWYHARICPLLLQNNICPQHSRSALAKQHLPSAFALSVRPQLLQNSIRPQLLQNGKFLLQALPPIVGLTLFGFFWSILLDCVRLYGSL